jgi:CHC2 zinc finger
MSYGPASSLRLRLYRPRPTFRSDWSEIRGRIDLTKVAAALLGPPVERRGLSAGSLGWQCPFHRGTSPSFRIILGEAVWSCSACGAGGDAAALVMRIKSVGFRDAIAWLDEQEGLSSPMAVAPDRHSVTQSRTVEELQPNDPCTVGELAVIMEFDRGLTRKIADRTRSPR